ncbi:MAG: DUF420 domain-containing protein [Planctomycetota bacterium]
MNRDLFLTAKPNLELSRKLTFVVWVVTAVVLLLVAAMRSPYKIPLPNDVNLKFIPAVNAILNSTVAVLLIFAVVMIKKGNIKWHQWSINLAMVISGLFLLCYVAYHFTTHETKFGGEGLVWWVYILILASHIILAAGSFPFILMTWVYANTNQFEKHRSLSKRVFPVWLYVAITGPICYLMLRPYY